jgi:hypothetical protein
VQTPPSPLPSRPLLDAVDCMQHSTCTSYRPSICGNHPRQRCLPHHPCSRDSCRHRTATLQLCLQATCSLG